MIQGSRLPFCDHIVNDEFPRAGLTDEMISRLSPSRSKFFFLVFSFFSFSLFFALDIPGIHGQRCILICLIDMVKAAFGVGYQDTQVQVPKFSGIAQDEPFIVLESRSDRIGWTIATGAMPQICNA